MKKTLIFNFKSIPGRLHMSRSGKWALRIGKGGKSERGGSKSACAPLFWTGRTPPAFGPGRALQGQTAAIPVGVARVAWAADRPSS